MSPQFRPTPGAKGYQHSCTPVLSSIPLLATLELIDKATFPSMLAKQKLLTGSLESLLKSSRFYLPPSASPDSPTDVRFKIITPEYPWRGTQLSILILPQPKEGERPNVMPRVFNRMLKKGLVGDEREPSVIRLSPVVLYNTFQEVGRAFEIFEQALEDEERYGGEGEEAKVNVDMTSKD